MNLWTRTTYSVWGVLFLSPTMCDCLWFQTPPGGNSTDYTTINITVAIILRHDFTALLVCDCPVFVSSRFILYSSDLASHLVCSYLSCHLHLFHFVSCLILFHLVSHFVLISSCLASHLDLSVPICHVIWSHISSCFFRVLPCLWSCLLFQFVSNLISILILSLISSVICYLILSHLSFYPVLFLILSLSSDLICSYLILFCLISHLVLSSLLLSLISTHLLLSLLVLFHLALSCLI